MLRYIRVIFLALVVLSAFESVKGRKFSGGRHSYPKSGGLSGSGGGHHYPSSGGLSGNNHGYPSSGGSHSYPSSGGSHGYPSSGGGSHSYPSSGSNSHGYPASGGLSGSGSHGYPSNKGLSGSGTSHTTNIHHHYNYNPPQKISYTPVHGGPAQSYPVYHGPPPTYVYQYRDSGSKYGTLLTGLALLNLGTLAGGLYANSHKSYTPKPGEVCKFAIKKENGDYEETKIDCHLISSFIYQEEAKTNSGAHNSTVTTTIVTNTTVVNSTNSASEPAPSPPELSLPLYTMFPNGTLVPVNGTMTNTTAANTTSADNSTSGGNTMTSSVTSVTTTTTNTTVTNALDVKGKPVDVTPGMKCYVIRNSPTSNMKRSVPCGLLQTYADQSLRKNSASKQLPSITILSFIFAVIHFY